MALCYSKGLGPDEKRLAVILQRKIRDCWQSMDSHGLKLEKKIRLTYKNQQKISMVKAPR